MPCLSRSSLAAAAWAACLGALPLAARAEGHDCGAQRGTWESDWSDAKKAWCCLHEQRGCPYNCTEGYSQWKSVWSDQKKEWCCEKKSLGCPDPRSSAGAYNCQRDYASRDSWSEEEKDWCCQTEQLGCFLPTSTATTTATTPQAARAHAPADEEPAAVMPATMHPTLATSAATTMHPTLATSAATTMHPTLATSAATTMHPTLATSAATTMHPTLATSAATTMHPTLATSASCFEDGIAWEPLDMPGALPLQAKTAAECQQRCAGTKGCVHFSYWQVGGNCHLQGAYTVRRTGRPGFLSGPFGCWDSLDQDKYVRKGHAILDSAYNCTELNTVYTPAMVESKVFSAEDFTEIEALKECRGLCASTDGCEHFTMIFPERLCQLAGEGSWQMTDYSNAVSGALSCWAGEERSGDAGAPAAVSDGDEAPELVMKTSLRRGGVPASRRPPLASAAAVLFAGACVAWGAVAVARRARRRPATRDLLVCGSEEQTAAGEE